MGRRENKVETHLKTEVKIIGGVSRKWVSPQHDGVPDQIVILKGVVWFVEVKTVDGVTSPAQHREHARLRNAGANVVTLSGKREVDIFLAQLKDSTHS